MSQSPNHGFGFRPVRTLGGNAMAFQSTKYPVNATNPAPIYIGDPVVLVSGSVQAHSSDGTRPILGVCKASYRGTGKNRPNTHRLPDNGNFIEATQGGWVDVYDDPDTIFEVATDSAVSNLDLGQIGDTVDASSSLSAGNSNTGLSRRIMSGVTIVVQSTSEQQTPFMMVGIAAREKVAFTSGLGYDFGTGSSGANIEVIIHNHVFRPKLLTGAA